MNWKHPRRRAIGLALYALLPSIGFANDKKVEDAEEIQIQLDDLEAQIKELRDQQEQGRDETDQTFDEMDEQMSGLSKLLTVQKPGKRKLLLTGYATGGFTNAQGQDSTFSGEFIPIFLWKVSDDLFFEGEVEFELEDTETLVGLEYAQMSYVVNDSMILGFGKFLNPANPFAERLHPAWINKLPDAPLAFGPMRVMSFTQTGMQVHGGVPIGKRKLNYAVYVSNGPSLQEDATNFGTLGDENVTDTNNNKAVGGRLGFFPLPELEIGYSIEFSQVNASAGGTSNADATIQSLDLSYVTSVAKGTLDIRSQWAFSNVDDVVFDPAGTAGFGPSTLNNRRNGGYAQCAFRPSESNSKLLSNLEGVVRFDKVDLPTGAPEGNDQSRWTVGMNYWTGASSVFKLAYRFDNTSNPGVNSDAVLFQWGIGL